MIFGIVFDPAGLWIKLAMFARLTVEGTADLVKEQGLGR